MNGGVPRMGEPPWFECAPARAWTHTDEHGRTRTGAGPVAPASLPAVFAGILPAVFAGILPAVFAGIPAGTGRRKPVHG
jgi:hypothetical protein